MDFETKWKMLWYIYWTSNLDEASEMNALIYLLCSKQIAMVDQI